MTVVLNGYPLLLENPVYARDGVTMVPVEEFCQQVGTVKTRPDDSSPLPGGLWYRWSSGEENTLAVGRMGHTTLAFRPGQAEMWEPVPAPQGPDPAPDDQVPYTYVTHPLPAPAELIGGVLYVPLRPMAEALGWQVEWVGSENIYLTEARREVEADTLAGFFNAIAPNTRVTLAPGTYDFAGLDPEQLDNPYVCVDYEVFNSDTGDPWGMDRWSVVIRGVSDLDVMARDVTFTTPWAYADVLRLEDCRRVGLTGFTAVHDVEPGYCTGNCLELRDCQTVRAMDCTLDGSGAWGLCANGCRDVVLENSAIQNCTYGAVSLDYCREVWVTDCEIAHCQGFALLSLSGTAGVQVTGCQIHDNALSLVSTYLDSREVVFEGCAFANCTFQDGQNFGSNYGWQQSGGAVLLNCASDPVPGPSD